MSVNLAEKIGDVVFLSDVPPLLALRVSIDPAAVLEGVRDVLISRLPEGVRQRTECRRR